MADDRDLRGVNTVANAPKMQICDSIRRLTFNRLSQFGEVVVIDLPVEQDPGRVTN